MKSRTSFFNGTVFRKNMTRFAPLWGSYTLCLLLGMFLLMDGDLEYWFAANLAQLISVMGLINLGYALLTAQVLFGDLWNARMCNALHAMPLRRECWFGTNVISGLVFNLLPNAIMAGVAIPLLASFSTMVNGWQIPLYWMLGSALSYLFFFGVAVFAALSAGSRVAMAMVYGILNFLSYLFYFLMEALVTPMYYGMVTQERFFRLLCPVGELISCVFLDCERHRELISAPGAEEAYRVHGTFTVVEENWWYLAAIALVGVALLLVARQMYRRRKLETAGDFMATKKLEPVFMVLFPLVCAAVFQFVYLAIAGGRELHVFLSVGLIVGWFAGRMLLERQANVFRSGKNWLGIVILSAVLGVSLYGLSLDPFGVEDYIPDGEDVASVSIDGSYRARLKLDSQEDIDNILELHRLILTEKVTQEDITAAQDEAYNLAVYDPRVKAGEVDISYVMDHMDYPVGTAVNITYQLKNGWTMSRRYCIWIGTEAAAIANRYFSTVEGVFGSDGYYTTNTRMPIRDGDDLLKLAETPQSLLIEGYRLPAELLTEQTVEALFQAAIADCEAGTMNQDSKYHEGFIYDDGVSYAIEGYTVDLVFEDSNLYFNIFADSENCLRWLEETGLREQIEDHIAASIFG